MIKLQYPSQFVIYHVLEQNGVYRLCLGKVSDLSASNRISIQKITTKRNSLLSQVIIVILQIIHN